MYQFTYAEIVDDAASDARGRERRAVKRGVELLEQAQVAGIRSRETVEALHYLRSLWSILIEDLAQPENDLPEALRADLISIGIWVLREVEQIRLERCDDLQNLIDINTMISEGLK
ncbi:MAG: flagellar protein FlaF [Saliniramus fredricksonii]|jgi:flagellar protein FlaF|uniref:Flagellar protein FlaF n=1 Tax=Saliniramus fredricksonii TaxID=1653334 RepID=A0A0N8KDL8_9HYPH|nr:flagellar biosynthesis regulator FlaF [Saliniramus fredricksonii]KPQ08898.1 MAG: flagellar protein FlaF [Saliniramus fredricksonii]SCC79110.1 flagellar protein FlaF [Saliniramus fredricksonii]